MIQSEGFLGLIDKMFAPAMRAALEVPGIVDRTKLGKSISNFL